jgi:hypothetical protein
MELSVSERLGAQANNPKTEGVAETILISLGQEWKVSYLEQRLKAQFEKWLNRNAILAILECEQLATDVEGDEKLLFMREASRLRETYSNARSAGAYHWMGEICRKALFDVPGTVQMLYLLLSRCHSDMTQEKAHEIFLANRGAANDAVWWALGKEFAPPQNEKGGA